MIKVRNTKANQFNENQWQAELEEVYSLGKVNTKGGALYDDAQFSGSITETRITWVPVPPETTAEAVQAKVDSLPNAAICKVLSTEPVMITAYKRAIENDEFDFSPAKLAENQLVKNNKGEVVLHGGNQQYSFKFFCPDTTKLQETIDSIGLQLPEGVEYDTRLNRLDIREPVEETVAA